MRRAGLLLILAAAAAARLWFLNAGVPHAVGVHEPEIVERAIRILHTGDWNTHAFDYPSLVIYFHAATAILRFLWGATQGEWRSLDGFSIEAIYGAGRFASACLGVATVWLTYRLGADLASRGAGLLAAAQLAVHSTHAGESHFIRTDVPMSLLTTMALWLTARAQRLGTARSYAWAGAACGLAAASKYTGGAVLVAAIAAWAVRERGAPGRGFKLAAIVGSAALAFLAAAPYTVLDSSAFLNDFAAEFARVAARGAGGGALRILAPPGELLTLLLAIVGAGAMLRRARTRAAAVPGMVFVVVYVLLLASHASVLDRSALPLAPLLTIYSAVGLIDVLQAVARVGALNRPLLRPLITGAVLLLVFLPPTAATVERIERMKGADTRTIAADWLKMNAPKGAGVGVERGGPTYLESAGFKVVRSNVLVERPPEWYRGRADYLVISAADLSGYGDYVTAGRVVFQMSPTPQRRGPPITVVSLR